MVIIVLAPHTSIVKTGTLKSGTLDPAQNRYMHHAFSEFQLLLGEREKKKIPHLDNQ